MPLRFHWFLPTSGASRHVVPGAGGHAREASLDYRVQIAAVTLFAVNASPSPSSTTHALATAVIELAGEGTVVDLADYDAGALLGRHADPDVDALLARWRRRRCWSWSPRSTAPPTPGSSRS